MQFPFLFYEGRKKHWLQATSRSSSCREVAAQKQKEEKEHDSHARSILVTLPSMTTVLPSMMAMRPRPSQFLKESTTNGCWGSKTTSATSPALRLAGSSALEPPVSLPIFQLILVILTAER